MPELSQKAETFLQTLDGRIADAKDGGFDFLHISSAWRAYKALQVFGWTSDIDDFTKALITVSASNDVNPQEILHRFHTNGLMDENLYKTYLNAYEKLSNKGTAGFWGFDFKFDQNTLDSHKALIAQYGIKPIEEYGKQTQEADAQLPSQTTEQQTQSSTTQPSQTTEQQTGYSEPAFPFLSERVKKEQDLEQWFKDYSKWHTEVRASSDPEAGKHFGFLTSEGIEAGGEAEAIIKITDHMKGLGISMTTDQVISTAQKALGFDQKTGDLYRAQLDFYNLSLNADIPNGQIISDKLKIAGPRSKEMAAQLDIIFNMQKKYNLPLEDVVQMAGKSYGLNEKEIGQLTRIAQKDKADQEAKAKAAGAATNQPAAAASTTATTATSTQSGNRSSATTTTRTASVAQSGAKSGKTATPSKPFDQLPREEQIKLIMTYEADSKTHRKWTREEAEKQLEARAGMKEAAKRVDEHIKATKGR